MSRQEKHKKTQIVFVLCSGIGDALYANVVIEEIKRQFESASITVLSFPRAYDIFLHNPNVDETLVMREKRVREKIRFFINIFKKLRKNPPDLFLLDSFMAKKEILFFLGLGYMIRAGKIVLAINSKNRIHSFLPRTDVILDRKNYFHMLDRYMALIHKKPPEDSAPLLYLSEEARRNAEEFFRENGITSKSLNIGVHPGGGLWRESKNKRWPLERFKELAAKIKSRYSNAHIIIFKGPDEQDMDDSFFEGCIVSAHDYLTDAAIIESLDIFVSNDTGLAHTANALKTDLVVIFGPTDPMRFRPLGKNVMLLKNDVCEPCNALRPCRHNKDRGSLCLNMEGILADELFEAIQSMVPEGKNSFPEQGLR
jgi:ADP-heptose:LPS heptosyltransferase